MEFENDEQAGVAEMLYKNLKSHHKRHEDQLCQEIPYEIAVFMGLGVIYGICFDNIWLGHFTSWG